MTGRFGGGSPQGWWRFELPDGGGRGRFPPAGGGMHPPFSFRLRRKENGPCTVQKKRRFWGPTLPPCGKVGQRGSSESVPPKFDNLLPSALDRVLGRSAFPHLAAWVHRRGGQRKAFPISPAAAARALQGSGSGKRRRNHAVLDRPRNSNSRGSRLTTSARPFPRPTLRPAGFYPRSLVKSASPSLTLHGSSLDKSVFSLTPCTARSLFAAAKREWGVHSRAAKRHIPRPRPWAGPVPRPWRGTPVPPTAESPLMGPDGNKSLSQGHFSAYPDCPAPARSAGPGEIECRRGIPPEAPG